MYEFDRSTPVTVVLRAHGGAVEIVAEERLTASVDVQPMGGNGADAAQHTRVLLEDDTLLVQVPGAEAWSWRRSPKLRITVRVPAGSSLAGKTASADVRALGVFGDVRLDVASADVELGSATGDVSLEAASGDLTVGQVGGSLRAKSSSGDLRIGDVTHDVNAESASGNIRTGTVGGSARAHTASGDIEIGSLRQGTADIRSASGDITVGVAAGSAVWMDVNTSSGKSITDLTARGETPPTDTPAELELRVRTASGDIRVHRAASARPAAAA
ncbi:DUF4097 family beta strand repeat-containing protein [Actinoplanes subtropicus]|uniref:DUF4097 family beta strand repeat-containing protein n=1 Tax=Actinoplanes subtropicus TaxID=543632 RepID=UPI0004C40029|nr:DUF4097 family beta strand repeat-containing protein [Actinoplanes subtropicus]